MYLSVLGRMLQKIGDVDGRGLGLRGFFRHLLVIHAHLAHTEWPALDPRSPTLAILTLIRIRAYIFGAILFLAVASLGIFGFGGFAREGQIGTRGALAFGAAGFLVGIALAVLFFALGLLAGALVFLGGLERLEKIIYTNFKFLILNVSIDIRLELKLVFHLGSDHLG